MYPYTTYYPQKLSDMQQQNFNIKSQETPAADDSQNTDNQNDSTADNNQPNNNNQTPENNSQPNNNNQTPDNNSQPNNNNQTPDNNNQPDSEPPFDNAPENTAGRNPLLINMIEKALQDKTNNAAYYARLAEKIPASDDMDVIHKIHLDELKHYKLLKDIYYSLTGKKADFTANSPVILQNLIMNFEDSFYKELKSVEFYRKLLFSFLNLGFRDYLFEIVTDEQAHAQKMSHLYSKYNK